MNKQILILLIFLSQFSFARPLKIGILNMSHSSTMDIRAAAGIYGAFETGDKKFTVGKKGHIILTVENNKIRAKYLEQSLGTFNKLKLVAERGFSSLKIKAESPERTFEGNFEIKVENGKLVLINSVDIDEYVEGVIESEGGNSNELEFLKVQAVICRTYALSHLNTHEGFDLCDQVHCQVYKGKVRFNKTIFQAVDDTRGKIIVDNSNKPINSAFHSNCGGQTTNSEDVWTATLPYLKSVQDTFCCEMPHAMWMQKISTTDWKKYLVSQDPNNNIARDTTKDSFSQTFSERKIDYEYKGVKVPLKKIRNDWKFRSTFFNMVQEGDSLTFYGKGFGHGVGMCQEGAMQMATKGYSYKDIINYYYQGVNVADISVIASF